MKKIVLYGLLLLLSISSCSEDYDVEEENLFEVGSLSDIDGNVYETIVIGDQKWMAENIKVSKYADGTEIPYLEDDDSWAVLEENNNDKAYCFYDNEEDEMGSVYGALYTYAAATNGGTDVDGYMQGVCPDGWHVPTSSEWLTLVNYVGDVETAGAYLKEDGTLHWVKTSSDVTNEYYFNALPGGYRYLYDGNFDRLGSVGYWWSSTQNTESDAYAFNFSNSTTGVYYSRYGKSYGMSVRCVED